MSAPLIRLACPSCGHRTAIRRCHKCKCPLKQELPTGPAADVMKRRGDHRAPLKRGYAVEHEHGKVVIEE